MSIGLQAILIGGFLLNVLLGFTLSWFAVDKLSDRGRKIGAPLKKGYKAVVFVTLGAIASIVAFAISIILIWQPHTW